MIDQQNHFHEYPPTKNIFPRIANPWLVEGFFYITFIAFIWPGEEPSKFNTLLAAWSSYAVVAFVLWKATKSGTIISPAKWIRLYFIQTIFLLIICNFIWLKGNTPRADGDYYDPIRFDYYAVILADSGMDPAAVTTQNYTGTIWYAGFIYWVFGVSKFYVTLFNGALSFVTWVLFVSIMRQIEGNLQRWQWLRFGMVLPDFLIHFASVSKEPLCAFLVALGIWVIAMTINRKQILSRLILLLSPVLIMGLVVRAATAVFTLVIAVVWFWKYHGRKARMAIIVFGFGVLISGQYVTGYVLEGTGAVNLQWDSQVSLLSDPASRMRESVDYSAGSWCVIVESLPGYLMPLMAPIKGVFMMMAPMPLWKLYPHKIFSDLINSRYGTPEITLLFRKLTAWLFVISLPFLSAALFDTYRKNRRFWIMFPLTFVLLVALVGFAAHGIVESRYRPMLLPMWLSVCGIGYYYGKPRRYVIDVVILAGFGAFIYLIPKFI